MKIVCTYSVELPQGRQSTIRRLLTRIRDGKHSPDYVDHHISDESFPEHPTDFGIHTITLVTFERVITHDESVVDLLREEGYTPYRARPVLALRQQNPKLHFGHPIVALGQPVMIDGAERVLTINRGGLHGICLRVTSGGWGDFWTFAVKPLATVGAKRVVPPELLDANRIHVEPV